MGLSEKRKRTVTLTEAAIFLFITNCSSVNQRKISIDNITFQRKFQCSNNSGGHVLKLLQVCKVNTQYSAKIRLSNLFLTSPVSIDIDHHQAFNTNP